MASFTPLLFSDAMIRWVYLRRQQPLHDTLLRTIATPLLDYLSRISFFEIQIPVRVVEYWRL